MATASSASSSLVMPQIFTNIASRGVRASRRPRPISRRGVAGRAVRRWPRRGRPRSPASRRPGRRRSRRRAARGRRPRPRDARLGDRARRRRDQRRPSARRGRVSTSKVTRSRWLTPIERRPDGERAGPARPRRAPRRARRGRRSTARRWKSTQLGVVERGDDQQHAVGAHQPGVAHVGGADREVLAQHRQRARGPGRWQVGDRAAEELLVGEHRQARARRRRRTPRASAAGSRSASRSPFDGERRLISVITASPSEPTQRGAGSRAPAASPAPRSTSSSSGRGRRPRQPLDGGRRSGRGTSPPSASETLALDRLCRNFSSGRPAISGPSAGPIALNRIGLAVGLERRLVGVQLVEVDRVRVLRRPRARCSRSCPSRSRRRGRTPAASPRSASSRLPGCTGILAHTAT